MLHHEVRRVAFDARVEDGDDVRVRQGSDRARLAEEPLADPVIVDMQRLDRDGAAEHLVVRAIDGAHRARTDLGGHLEPPEPLRHDGSIHVARVRMQGAAAYRVRRCAHRRAALQGALGHASAGNDGQEAALVGPLGHPMLL